MRPITIDEALLREAEQATNIHDWSALVKKGLQALSQRPVRTEVTQAPFDFDAALAAAAELPDLSDEEFE
ncbi:MAG: type II toxin-antitoxin system VapB family antitoxin [Prosthecobacter sp.]|nr:type II toxin-antitoxin system VapB family antitoxin [Prosthecobacter sp.]